MESITHSSVSLTLLLFISAVAVWIVHRVFQRFRGSSLAPHRFGIQVQQLGGFSQGQLMLVSLLSLFLGMLMIRWVSSEIRIFAYFKNFVLVACFLGFGLGCYLCRRRIQLIAMIAPLLLLTIILKAPISPLRRTMTALPQLLGAGVEVHVWGVPALPTSWTGMLLAVIVVVPLFAVIATTFIPLGQLAGWYLENAPNGVAAYSVNVLASLAGIAAFSLMCFLWQPPWVWFLVAGTCSLMVFWRNPAGRKAIGATFLAWVVLLAIPDHRNESTYWVPYQKLVVRPIYGIGQVEAYSLTTNDSLYQTVVNLSSAFV